MDRQAELTTIEIPAGKTLPGGYMLPETITAGMRVWPGEPKTYVKVWICIPEIYGPGTPAFIEGYGYTIDGAIDRLCANIVSALIYLDEQIAFVTKQRAALARFVVPSQEGEEDAVTPNDRANE